jgi:hypothetical protein
MLTGFLGFLVHIRFINFLKELSRLSHHFSLLSIIFLYFLNGYRESLVGIGGCEDTEFTLMLEAGIL